MNPKKVRRQKSVSSQELKNKNATKPTEDNSPYVFQKEKINYELSIKELPWTDKQKEIISTFLDKKTKVLLLKGPAGTSKTFLSMYCGLTLLNKKRVSDLVLVRSAVESSDSKLGFLPGDIMEKFNVYLTPFHDKFSELLSKSNIDRLQKDNRLTICPINFARGLHFSAKFVCADEIQNFSTREIHTIMSRIGEFSKVFLCGDPEQSDLPHGKSGFAKVYDLFDNDESKENGIFCMELTEEDIVRSELCRFITHKFKELTTSNISKHEENNKEIWKPGNK
jgi:phosphate starvation-inducible PhoH-like protein